MAQTILFLAANPLNTDRLRLDKEVSEIAEGLRRAKQRDKFKLEQSWAVNADSLRRAILDHEPTIVHFSGHGTGDDGIVLEDSAGMPTLVSTDALEGLFALFPSIECVVLNACYSQVQAEAIAKHVNYVIGMAQQIGDEPAKKFAVGFYDALGANKSIEFAYKLGCNAIHLAGDPEHLTPTLLIRPGYQPKENQPEVTLPSSPAERKSYLPIMVGIALLVLIVIGIAQLVGNLSIGTTSTTETLLTITPSVTTPTSSSPATLTFAAQPTVQIAASTTNPASTEVPSTLQVAQITQTISSGQKDSALAPLMPPPTATVRSTPTPPTALNVTNSAGRSIHPQLIGDSAGNMHLFWLDNTLRQAKGYDVLHRQRTIDGEWSDVTNLTDRYPAYDGGVLLARHDPTGNVCIFFQKYDNEMQDLNGLHLRCLIDGNWSEDKLIVDADPGTKLHPVFSADGTAQLVFQYPGDYDRPEFAGNDLSDVFDDFAYATVFEIDQTGGYHVAWIQTMKPGLFDLKYRYSKDAGETWQQIITLNDENSVPDAHLLRSVLDSRGRVHLVWGGLEGLEGNVFYRYWTSDGGWSEINPLNIDKRVRDLSVDHNDLLQFVWQELGDVLYTQQQPDGTWASIAINPKQENSEPVITVDTQNSKHFAWVEKDEDIYYAVLP